MQEHETLSADEVTVKSTFSINPSFISLDHDGDDLYLVGDDAYDDAAV